MGGSSSSAALLQFLQDTLCCDAGVAVVATISPFVQAADETRAALDLALRVHEEAQRAPRAGASRALRLQVAHLQTEMQTFRVSLACALSYCACVWMCVQVCNVSSHAQRG
jgi:hypothetical protein